VAKGAPRRRNDINSNKKGDEKMENRKPVKVGFEGRRTGMGGTTICTVYSLRQKKELKPAYTDTSRTGNHWTDYYWLFPAKYILACQEISNAGNHHCFVAIIKIDEEGKYEKVKEFSPQEIPDFVFPPCECLQVIPEE
jgi:hypothetical protein